MKERNNKGSALVLVLVIFAIIGILATLALWVSVRNFQMKVTDSKIKNNFYSAESVLDQVCVGLQGDVSVAYQSAYLNVMQDYNTTLTAAQREDNFRRAYLDSLKAQLWDETAPDKEKAYKSDLIESKIDRSAVPAGCDVDIDCGSCAMMVASNSITLKGVTVTYTDAADFTSIIQTDIVLEVPTMRSVTSSDLPAAFSYSLIGNSGVRFMQPSVSYTIGGNVYAGSTNITHPEWSTASDDSLIVVGPITFDQTGYVVVDGEMIVEGGTVTTSSNTQLWSQNVTVNSGIAQLYGSTYLSDDLTLRGTNSQAKLGRGTGKFYGYGNSTSGSTGSSAIILNGKGSELDASGLSELVVAGYSYIGTSAFSGKDGNANSNIMMGESICAKGDQIAYLIPGDCIGTNGTENGAVSYYGRNPLSYAEYEALEALVNNHSLHYVWVNENTVSSKTGNALSHYLGGAGVDSVVSKVFDNKKKLVYFYVNLPTDAAEDYFNDYYEIDKDGAQKIDLYTKYYSSNIKYNPSPSTWYTAGSYVSYDGAGNIQINSGSTYDITSKISRLPYTYEALSTILAPNYNSIDASEFGKTVYENLVNTDIVNEICSTSANAHGSQFVYSANGVTYEVIVVTEGPYNYTGNTADMTIVVGTADVVINNDFKGIIMINGSIQINGGTKKIEGVTEQEARRLLAATFEMNGRTYTAYELFKGGNPSWIGGLAYEGEGSVGNDTYGDLISYRNWTKK